MNIRYLELLIHRTLAGLYTEASQTYLSFIWWIVEPILYMLTFYFVFGFIFQRGDGDYIPFVLCGLTAWKWFGASVDSGANAIRSNASLMGQVHVPKILFPSISILQNSAKFIFVLVILILVIQFIEPGISLTYLALPVVLFTQLSLISACAFLLSAFVPFIPDLSYLVRNGLQLMFFASGIFYSVSEMPESYQHIFYLNPMVTIIDSYRDIFMFQRWPDFPTLGFILGLSLVGVLLAYIFIKKYDRVYPKMV